MTLVLVDVNRGEHAVEHDDERGKGDEEEKKGVTWMASGHRFIL